MSNIKPGPDEMPILTLADRRAAEADRVQFPPEVSAAAKYNGLDGAHLSVQALRTHLDDLTMRLDRGWDRVGRPFKPMQRRTLQTQADAVATCIELLTVNGNYYRERHESLARLRPLSTGPLPG